MNVNQCNEILDLLSYKDESQFISKTLDSSFLAFHPDRESCVVIKIKNKYYIIECTKNSDNKFSFRCIVSQDTLVPLEDHGIKLYIEIAEKIFDESNFTIYKFNFGNMKDNISSLPALKKIGHTITIKNTLFLYFHEPFEFKFYHKLNSDFHIQRI